MHPQSLYPKTAQVLAILAKKDFIYDFYLAGGTALALQLGHRKSIDLYFFINGSLDTQKLLILLKDLNPVLLQETEGTLDLTIDSVKVSFLEYKYPLIGKLGEYEKVNLASVIDIACMKLSAVSSRGSKKDFVDLFFILKHFNLSELFNYFEKKFLGINYSTTHILKSLTYFADAEEDPEVDMLEPMNWEQIKLKLELTVKAYLTKQAVFAEVRS